MTDDIIATLRHHYCVAGTEPTHPVRRAIEEIERLRGERDERAEWFARVAYRLADAMMEEREK